MKSSLSIVLLSICILTFSLGSCAQIDKSSGGSISGRVYEADGVTPVSGANVTVAKIRHPIRAQTSVLQKIGSIGLTQVIKQTQVQTSDDFELPPPYPKPVVTNRNGKYTYGDLPPGDYLVLVNSHEHVPEFHDGVYTRHFAHMGETKRIDDYYWGDYTERGATIISVEMGSQIKGVDFTLERPASISGMVYTPEGQAAVRGNVKYDFYVVLEDIYDDRIWFLTWVKKDGSYSTGYIPESDYRIRGTVLSGQSHRRETTECSTRDIISLRAGEHIQSLDIEYPYDGAITGYITLDNRDIELTAEDALEIVAEPVSDPSIQCYSQTGLVDLYMSYGNIHIRFLPPGEYRLKYRYTTQGNLYSGYYHDGESAEKATGISVGPYETVQTILIDVSQDDLE